MIFQDGQAIMAPEGDGRAQNVMDNLIYRREIPVMISVFINPRRRPDQPEPNLKEWGDRTTNRPTEYTVAWEWPDQLRKVLSIVGSFVNLRGGHAYADLVRKTDKKPIRIFLQDGRNDNRGIRNDRQLRRDSRLVLPVREAHLKALTDKGYDVNYAWGMNKHGQKMGGAIMPGDDALVMARSRGIGRSQGRGGGRLQRTEKEAGPLLLGRNRGVRSRGCGSRCGRCSLHRSRSLLLVLLALLLDCLLLIIGRQRFRRGRSRSRRLRLSPRSRWIHPRVRLRSRLIRICRYTCRNVPVDSSGRPCRYGHADRNRRSNAGHSRSALLSRGAYVRPALQELHVTAYDARLLAVFQLELLAVIGGAVRLRDRQFQFVQSLLCILDPRAERIIPHDLRVGIARLVAEPGAHLAIGIAHLPKRLVRLAVQRVLIGHTAQPVCRGRVAALLVIELAHAEFALGQAS